MRIGMVQNNSPYDVQEFLFQQIQVVLKEEGHETEIIPLKYSENEGEMEDIMMTRVAKGDFDLLFTIDLTGFERRLMEDECFYNNLYCPMIHLITKDAWYFSHYLGQRLNFSMFFYIENQYNVRYIRDTFRHFPNIDLLTPVGFQVSQKKWEDRTIDVYCPATYENPQVILEQIEQLPEVFRRLCLHLIERMKVQGALSFYDAVAEALRQIGFEYNKTELVDIMTELSAVTKYLKMYFIDSCVRNLLDAGISVTVSGKGWENYTGTEGRQPVILGNHGISYQKQLETMGNAKVILHNQSHKSDDLSERVLNGLLQGAVVLSDRIYADERVKKEVVTYDICHLERLPGIVTEILQQPSHQSEISAEDYSLRPAVLKMVENCFS